MDTIVHPLLTSNVTIAARVTCSCSFELLLNRRLLQSTTRNVRLRVMLVPRGTNPITRPVSETVAVKAACYELLSVNGPSFRYRLALSTASAAQGCMS